MRALDARLSGLYVACGLQRLKFCPGLVTLLVEGRGNVFISLLTSLLLVASVVAFTGVARCAATLGNRACGYNCTTLYATLSMKAGLAGQRGYLIYRKVRRH